MEKRRLKREVELRLCARNEIFFFLNPLTRQLYERKEREKNANLLFEKRVSFFSNPVFSDIDPAWMKKELKVDFKHSSFLPKCMNFHQAWFFTLFFICSAINL